MSKWKVSSTYAGGETYYQVYRIKDDDGVDHSGNREVVALYRAKDAAELLASN